MTNQSEEIQYLRGRLAAERNINLRLRRQLTDAMQTIELLNQLYNRESARNAREGVTYEQRDRPEWVQPCGHATSSVVCDTDLGAPGTCHCGECERQARAVQGG